MLTTEDLGKYKAFKAIIKRGRFEIAGEAVSVSGLLFTWFDNLEKEIEKQIYPESIEIKKQKLKG